MNRVGTGQIIESFFGVCFRGRHSEGPRSHQRAEESHVNNSKLITAEQLVAHGFHPWDEGSLHS